MISTTREECQWLLGNLARGLVEYLGVVEPPIPVEDLLEHPPSNFDMDFGVVNMYSHLWDATFARTPSQRGSVFVRIDLDPEERRYSLAREALTAMVTSEHGRAMGLPDLLLSSLREWGEYFARQLLAPDLLVNAYRERGGGEDDLADTFQMPSRVAALRWQDAASVLN
jgi:hypothetical protein